MTSFKFPPPPPPPPKATANDAQESYSSQRGGFNNARGGRGRGWQGRGRGNNSRGGSRGGRGQGHGHGHSDSHGHGNVQTNGTSRGGYQQRERGGNQQRGTPQRQTYLQSQPSAPQPTTPNIHSGAYVNPLFANHLQHVGPPQPQPDPAAFAQAMAFISTPAGMQTMAAFASHMANGNQAPYIPPAPPPQSLPQFSPPENRKRKRNEHIHEQRQPNAPPPTQNPQSKQKPPRAKAAAPPPVPSFGFTLPTVQTSQTISKPNPVEKGGQSKRKVHLGLTHHEEEVEESDKDDDANEEATLASRGNIEGVSFEYGGQSISLQTPTEVAAWVKDRRRQFPNPKRYAEKAREAADRRAGELEFLRKVKGKKTKENWQTPSVISQTLAEARKASVEKNKAEQERLRQKLMESMAMKKGLSSDVNTSGGEPGDTKPPTVDLGLGYGSESDASGNGSSMLSESSVVSSSDEASEILDSDSDDSDAAPEVQSSNAPPPAIVRPPAPVPIPDQKKKGEQQLCHDFRKYGKCTRGRRCRFFHPPKEGERRMTLHERLVEQEKEKADRLALDAIKYLGRNGFLG